MSAQRRQELFLYYLAELDTMVLHSGFEPLSLQSLQNWVDFNLTPQEYKVYIGYVPKYPTIDMRRALMTADVDSRKKLARDAEVLEALLELHLMLGDELERDKDSTDEAIGRVKRVLHVLAESYCA